MIHLSVRRSLNAMACLLALGAACPAHAQIDAVRPEFNSALKDAQAAQLLGPTEVPLADQASLKLPAEYAYVPGPAAARLLRAMGNTPDASLVGVVFPGPRENWMMVVQFEKVGFIKDDAARDWNIDELLRSVREGTEESNAVRRQKDLPEIEVLGWADKPHYDASTHRLVWAMVAHDKNAQSGVDQGVNYNTFILGRDGYFKFNLVTDLKALPAQRPAAEALVGNFDYLDGKRYADFNVQTDKIADFGIAALIAGVAAKKAGLVTAISGAAKIAAVVGVLIVLLVVVIVILVVLQRRKRMRAVQNEFPSTVMPVDDFPPTEMFHPTVIDLEHGPDEGSLGATPQPPVDLASTSLSPASANIAAPVPAPKAQNPMTKTVVDGSLSEG